VHADCFSPLAILAAACSDGVKLAVISADVPFVFAQPVIVIGIDDGKQALSQGYLPEGAAVVQPAV
jgi:hypothetical protein